MFRLSWAWGSSGPRSKLHCGIRYDGFGCLVLGLKGFLMQEFAKTDRPWPDILGLFHNVRFSFGILTRVDSGISYKIRTKEFSTAAIWKKNLFVFTAVPWQRNCYFEAAGNHLARLAIAPERLPSADSLVLIPDCHRSGQESVRQSVFFQVLFLSARSEPARHQLSGVGRRE